MKGWLVAVIGFDPADKGKVQFGIVMDEWKINKDGHTTDWGTKIGDATMLSAYVPDFHLLSLKELPMEDRDLTPNEALKKYKDLIIFKLLDGIRGEAITAEYEQEKHRHEIEQQTSALKALLVYVFYP